MYIMSEERLRIERFLVRIIRKKRGPGRGAFFIVLFDY